MTPDQKLDLLEARPIGAARHWIPSDRIRFVVESADRHWLARVERWWQSGINQAIEYAEAQAIIDASIRREL